MSIDDFGLEKVYRLRWLKRYDPFTPEGRSRYLKLLEEFKLLIRHPWLRDFVARKASMDILDLCGGGGIAGVALAKILIEHGVDVRLTVLDLREEALRKALMFARDGLGLSIEVVRADARTWKPSKEYDIVLFFGSTAAHFNPWEFMLVLLNAALASKRNGLMLLEEHDRVSRTCIDGCFEKIHVDYASKDSIVLSVFKNYEPVTGDIHVVVVDLVEGVREEIKHHIWGLAELLLLTNIVYEEVNFKPGDRGKGYIIARKPRPREWLEMLARNPPRPPTSLKPVYTKS